MPIDAHEIESLIRAAFPNAQVSVQLAGEKHAVAFGPWMATKIPGSGPNLKTGLPCGKAPGAA